MIEQLSIKAEKYLQSINSIVDLSSIIARPYVYVLIHKITKQFYYGFRCRNVEFNRLAVLDIGIYYKTSSRYIDEIGFENFDYYVIQEFNNKLDAYWFEQELIKNDKGNLLMINKKYVDRTTRKCAFINDKPHREETKEKIAKSLTGNIASSPTKIRMSLAKINKPQSANTQIKKRKTLARTFIKRKFRELANLI